MNAMQFVCRARRLLTPALLIGAGVVVCLGQTAPGDQAGDLCRHGLALKRAGQLEAAAVAFREAISVDPARAEAHRGLAWVLATQGRKADAIVEFRRVLDLVGTGPMAEEAAAALKRLGAPPLAEPPEPPGEEAITGSPVEAAQRLLRRGEASAALRVLRGVPEDDALCDQARALMVQVKQGRRRVLARAAVDQVLRAQEGWEERIRERFTFAAEQISRQVEIDLALLDVQPWERLRGTTDGLDLIEELRGDASPGKADLVLGFAGETREVEMVDGQPTIRGHTLGLSPCFAGYGIVAEVIASRDGQQFRVPEETLRETLVHELGHLFGAVHVSDDSVMRATPSQTRVYTFDRLNLEVLRVCRWMDFSVHLASLSEDELERLTDLYAELAAGPASDDGVHFYRALVCTQLRQYDEAIGEYLQVLSVSPRDAYTHYNLAELLYYQRNNSEAARLHWRQAAGIGRPECVAELAKQALAQEGQLQAP